MRYLDRLIQRARAVPRDSVAALFDPFEQVAPWPLDAPEPAPGAAVPPPLTPAAPPTIEARQAADPGEDRTPFAPLEEIMAKDTAASRPERPQPLVPEPAPVQALPSDPLEIADAFMRALEPAATPRPAAAAAAAEIVQPPVPPPRNEDIPVVRRRAEPPDRPALVAPPPPPPAATWPAPLRSEAPAPAAPSPARRSAVDAQRSPTPAPAAPLVMPSGRVIVRAGNDERLADLAHGSRIVHFGLRQG